MSNSALPLRPLQKCLHQPPKELYCNTFFSPPLAPPLTSEDKTTIHPKEGQRAYQRYTHCDVRMPSASIVSLSFVGKTIANTGGGRCDIQYIQLRAFHPSPQLFVMSARSSLSRLPRHCGHHNAFYARVSWPGHLLCAFSQWLFMSFSILAFFSVC